MFGFLIVYFNLLFWLQPCCLSQKWNGLFSQSRKYLLYTIGSLFLTKRLKFNYIFSFIQVETWLRDASNYVKNAKIESKKSRSKKNVETLSNLLTTFMENSLTQQEDRVSKLSRLASALQNADAKRRAGDLIFKQERVRQKLSHLGEILDGKIVKLDQSQSNGAHDVSRVYLNL